MRLLRTSLLARSSIAAVAGVALIVPLTSVASAENDDFAPAVMPLPALESSEYVTLDDTFQAPSLTTTTTGQEDPNLLLTTPGPGGTGAGSAAVYDNSGNLIWENPGSFYNLEQITWQGQPALVTFDVFGAQHLIFNQQYQQIGTVSLQNGIAPTDGHDIEVSPDGSRVLLQGWATTNYDLSPWGGPSNGIVLEPVIQELDLATNQVTFEWRSLDHISPEETTEPMTGFGDLFHSNSLEYDDDGNIITSFRNTSTVYKIDKNSGNVIWRLGGVNNDFNFTGGSGDMFSYQHDARRLDDGTLTVFDNGNGRSPQESRGLAYQLDESSMTATVVEELRANPPAFTAFVGNNRQVSNGNQILGFGTTGRMVEFSGGQEVFSGTFSGNTSSYRMVRAEGWTGTPAAPPEVVVSDAAEDGSRTLNVSWNGATEVDAWRIQAGTSEGSLTTLGTTPKTGFETAAQINAPANADVFKVTALDADGKALDSRTLSAS